MNQETGMTDLSDQNPPLSRFKTPGEAKLALVEERGAWTGALGNRSLEACYAVVAAVWAVYGKSALELGHPFAALALMIAVGFVGINLLAMGVYVGMLETRLDHARNDPKSRQEEWEARNSPGSPFPWTLRMESFTVWYHRLKPVFPILATLCLMISLWP